MERHTVTVEYENDKPKRIETILISTQHLPTVSNEQIKKDIIEKVIKRVVPSNMIDKNTKIYINPTGRFVIGGVFRRYRTYRKKNHSRYLWRICKTWWRSFFWKRCNKVDRSAAYMLRHIAKNIVAKWICEKCEIQVAYAIGKRAIVNLH